MKAFTLVFLYRHNGQLETGIEQIETTSKTAAVKYGKQIAQQRSWRFLEAREKVTD